METRTLPKAPGENAPGKNAPGIPGTAIVRREMAARNWTPSDGRALLRRLAASRELTVRYLVAANACTPQDVLDRLAADADPMVAWAARRAAGGLPDYEHIPVIVFRRIVCDHVMTDDVVETLYRLTLLGLFEVDASGQVWWLGRLRHEPYDPHCRLIHEPRKPVPVIPRPRYTQVAFLWRYFRIRTEAHRLIYRMFRGRIPRGYWVHHLDRNPENNSLANLQLILAGDHIRLHLPDVRRGQIRAKARQELAVVDRV